MKLSLVRFSHGRDDTLGLLFIDGEFECFTLEDEKRTQKVFGETRIPEGHYEIRLRKEGGFHWRYLQKFGSKFHRGMLHLQNIPNFKYVLIHIGNTDDDTAGCLLVGTSAVSNVYEKGRIGSSTLAYERFYPKVAAALESGEKVYIHIKSLNVKPSINII